MLGLLGSGNETINAPCHVRTYHQPLSPLFAHFLHVHNVLEPGLSFVPCTDDYDY